jgi:hypothetical protein
MFASLLTAAMLFMLFVPGLFFAYKKQSLNQSFLLKCMLFNFSFFAIVGLVFSAIPWLIDPRFHL